MLEALEVSPGSGGGVTKFGICAREVGYALPLP